jgi:glycosyltransferase involved in cell wall biosynthesis
MQSNTTNLIVEYLVAGILTIVALFLALLSLFGDTMLAIAPKLSTTDISLMDQIGMVAILTAIAYALGIVMEYIGERVFEGVFDSIKVKRVGDYLTNSKHEKALACSPILESFRAKPSAEWEKDELKDCIGNMRFYVMHHSSPLYADIAAQINRFRLIRVLFLVEGLIALSLIVKLVSQWMEPLWWFALGLIIIIAVANYRAIRSRFGRYCRSVERSYLILMRDQITTQTADHKTSAKAHP